MWEQPRRLGPSNEAAKQKLRRQNAHHENGLSPRERNLQLRRARREEVARTHILPRSHGRLQPSRHRRRGVLHAASQTAVSGCTSTGSATSPRSSRRFPVRILYRSAGQAVHRRCRYVVHWLHVRVSAALFSMTHHGTWVCLPRLPTREIVSASLITPHARITLSLALLRAASEPHSTSQL